MHRREGGIVALTLTCSRENKPELKLDSLSNFSQSELRTRVFNEDIGRHQSLKLGTPDTPVLICIA